MFFFFHRIPRFCYFPANKNALWTWQTHLSVWSHTVQECYTYGQEQTYDQKQWNFEHKRNCEPKRLNEAMMIIMKITSLLLIRFSVRMCEKRFLLEFSLNGTEIQWIQQIQGIW